MSVPSGKHPLQKLANFVLTGWYTKAIPALIESLKTAYGERSEIKEGGVITAGASVTASVLQIDMTALRSVMKGRLMADIAAQSDVDLFTTASAVGRATYQNGADAAGISLDTDETAYVTVIACNTDGAGDAVEDDNGAPKLVALVKGTSTTYAAQTAHLTSTEIQAALEAATGVHAGVTSWVHVAQILWDENSASPQVTITLNRNNVLAA